MNKLILAAALALAPTTGDAAVTFYFHGTTDPFNSYTTTQDGTVYDAASDFDGSVTIDTDAIGANHATPDALDYDGGGSPFLSATFHSAGSTPLLFMTGDLQHYLQSDPTNGSFYLQIGWTLANGDTSGFVLSGGSVPTADFTGVLLPDLNRATDLYVGVSSHQSTRDGFVELYASGPASFGAVPEPASWALMIAGFGTVGGALRRRRALVAA